MTQIIIFVIAGLFGIAFYSLLISRNLIKVIICLQILVKGGMLAIIMAGNLCGNTDLAQSMAVTIIVADTVVAVLALALTVQIKQLYGKIDTKILSTLRR